MKTVLLVGCGNMGFAMMQGWMAANPDLRVLVTEPVADLRERATERGAIAASDMSSHEHETPQLIILAVKPHMTANVAGQCREFAAKGATIISVAAGISISALDSALPPQSAIIRCMPNTPAAIGEGVMALFANAFVGADQRDAAMRLLSVSGPVFWLDDESQMDAVTAISGSGPAYVFHFIEAIAAAGQTLGLSQEMSGKIALQTIAGAAKLAVQSDESPGVLRQRVTSPQGTTAAALAVLQGENALKDLVLEATTAARDRSIELGGN